MTNRRRMPWNGPDGGFGYVPEPKPQPIRVTLTCANTDAHRWETKMARVRVEAGFLRWRAERETCPKCGGAWALAFDHDA